MRRSYSLFALVVQILLIAGMLVLVDSAQSDGFAREKKGETLFKALAILVVLLSPFGIGSAVLSAGFSILTRTEALGPAMVDRASVPTLEMNFVWKELRDEYLAKNSGEGR